MAYRSSSSLTGASTTPSVTVPAGAATDDIALLTISGDDPSFATNFAAKLPAGFASLGTFTNTLDGQGGGVAWKRLTGADSGSYTFSAFTVNTAWAAGCVLLSGRDTTNPPVAGTINQVNTGATSITENANGVTASAGDDLAWFAWEDQSSSSTTATHTAPTGYDALRVDTARAFASLGIATLNNSSAGATGTVAGHCNTGATSAYSALLVRVPAASGGTTPVSTTATSSIDAAAAVDAEVSSPWNALASLAAAASSPVDALAGAAQLLVPAVDAPAQLLVLAVGRLDALAGAAQVVTAPVDALASPLAAILSPVDAVASLQSAANSPVDALASIALPASSPWDATGTALTVVSTSALVVVDATGAIAAAAVSPLDAVGQLAIARTAAWEALATITPAVLVTRVDAPGGAGQLVQAGLDATGPVSNLLQLSLDAVATLQLAQAASWEAQAGIQLLLNIPVDALGITTAQLLTVVDAEGLITTIPHGPLTLVAIRADTTLTATPLRAVLVPGAVLRAVLTRP